MTKVKLRLVFSKHVLANRTRLGLTQQQVATSVSSSLRWIQKIESGAKLPGFYLAIRLTLSLNIDLTLVLSEFTADSQSKEANRHHSVSSS